MCLLLVSTFDCGGTGGPGSGQTFPSTPLPSTTQTPTSEHFAHFNAGCSAVMNRLQSMSTGPEAIRYLADFLESVYQISEGEVIVNGEDAITIKMGMAYYGADYYQSYWEDARWYYIWSSGEIHPDANAMRIEADLMELSQIFTTSTPTPAPAHTTMPTSVPGQTHTPV